MATKPSNGRLTNNQRSAVRVVLATGATLMTLITAQMFASSGAVNSAASAATTTTTQNTSTTTQDTSSIFNSDDSSTILLTGGQSGTIYYSPFQQPVPSSRSSR